jgi:hypothetical protein
VGNEENGYSAPDSNKTMINVTKEPSDSQKTQKKSSNRKTWKKSLESWRRY